MTGDDALADQVMDDYRLAELDARTRGLMDYAVRLTRDPRGQSEEDVRALRELGWSDEEILTATHVIGFFNYYVRMAEALGVEPEDFMSPGEASD